MRPSNIQRAWTHPELPMPPAFHRMSFALYRAEGDMGRVLAARIPEQGPLGVGDRIQDSLDLCPDALAYMTRLYGGGAPLFALTRAGIGLLSSRYSLGAGLGLYLHIHTRPEAAARLINSGVLGDPTHATFEITKGIRDLGDVVRYRDQTSYPALKEAWEAFLRGGDGPFSVDRDSSLSLLDLRRGIAALADFVGCDVRFSLPKRVADGIPVGSDRVKCYRPLVLEAILLCLLAEARIRSEGGGCVCRLEPRIGNREGLGLTLRYSVGDTAAIGHYADTHEYLTGVGERWGLDLYAPNRPLRPRDPDGLPEAAVSLEWLMDPSVVSSSDIKAFLAGIRAEREEETEPSWVEEIPFSAVFG